MIVLSKLELLIFFLLNSTTAINGDTLNGDSDLSSTSSQTSSEHDPSVRARVSPDQSNEYSTVNNFDQIPEYKLFNSNTPSIHSILFGNNENTQPMTNGNNGIEKDP